jgi:hypothetical protein
VDGRLLATTTVQQHGAPIEQRLALGQADLRSLHLPELRKLLRCRGGVPNRKGKEELVAECQQLSPLPVDSVATVLSQLATASQQEGTTASATTAVPHAEGTTPLATTARRTCTSYLQQLRGGAGVRWALRRYPRTAKKTLQQASVAVRNDRDVIMAAVAIDGNLLKLGGRSCRADRDIVMAAVNDKGLSLQHASAKLRDDEEVVLAAIRRDPDALQHASARLRAKREVVMAAITQYPCALRHASASLRGNREVVTAALRQCCPGSDYYEDSNQPRWRRTFLTRDTSGYVLRYASLKLQHELRGECGQKKRKRAGRQGILPACDGKFYCAMCWSSEAAGAPPLVKRRKTANPNPRERLKSHVKARHQPSDVTHFVGTVKNPDGQRHYALCVYGCATCVYSGPVCEGEEWVRHPDARAWQARMVSR